VAARAVAAGAWEVYEAGDAAYGSNRIPGLTRVT